MDQQFDYLFNKYKNDVYRLAYSYMLNVEDAEDITQKVFIKLYKHKVYIPDGELKKWLFRVTINNCKDYFRASFFRKRSNVSIDDLSISSNFTFDKTDEDFLKQLQKINKKYVIVLYLYYYLGYNVEEIASIINISESGVKSRLRRGKIEFKKEMERF